MKLPDPDHPLTWALAVVLVFALCKTSMADPFMGTCSDGNPRGHRAVVMGRVLRTVAVRCPFWIALRLSLRGLTPMTKHEEALRRSVHDLVCMTPVACEHGRILPGCMARVEEALPIAMGFYALGWNAGAEAQRVADLAIVETAHDLDALRATPAVTLHHQ